MTHARRISLSTVRWIACAAVVVLLPSAAQAVDAEFAAFCERYTSDAVAAAAKNKELKCGGDGPRWGSNREDHFNWCISLDGEFSPAAIEGSERLVLLKDCTERIEAFKAKGVLQNNAKATEIVKTDPPPPPTTTVKLDVQVFDAADGVGNLIGELGAGDKVVIAGGTCPRNWCHVQGPAVPNGDGYVYDGPDYDSL